MKTKSGTRILFLTVALLLLVLFVFGAVKLYGALSEYQGTPSGDSKTIERDGVQYFPRQDINVLMLIGVDEFGKVAPSGSYKNTGEADMVALVVFDETAERFDVLMLNRDMILRMPVLGLSGAPAGYSTAQLALAHTYGDGLEESCENTRNAVSDYFYGTVIDHYMSINMDAISILTDAVGGVQVTVTDDFSAVNENITQGSLLLDGGLALDFIRSRQDVGNQLNLSRMQRQSEYIRSFVLAFSQRLAAGDSFVVDTYEAISDYSVSDLSATTLNTMLNRYRDYTFGRILTLYGENQVVNGYMQYHVTEESRDEILFSLFYAEKTL